VTRWRILTRLANAKGGASSGLGYSRVGKRMCQGGGGAGGGRGGSGVISRGGNLQVREKRKKCFHDGRGKTNSTLSAVRSETEEGTPP